MPINLKMPVYIESLKATANTELIIETDAYESFKPIVDNLCHLILRFYLAFYLESCRFVGFASLLVITHSFLIQND